jgi:hypothetical protein
MRKYLKSLIIILLVALSLVGCNSENFGNPEQIPEAIEQIVKTTEKVITDKDSKTARALWSKISEYGLKAGEAGYKELGESLGKLASTYTNLVQYLETGEEKDLDAFRESFAEALEELKELAPTESGGK